MTVTYKDRWQAIRAWGLGGSYFSNATNKLSWVTRMLILALTASCAHAASNALPPEAQLALHSGGQAVIYSLEPWDDPEKKVPRLHGFEILGQATLNPAQASSAVAAFDVAIRGFDNVIAACFDPRHAIRIQANGHTYDFLLCYSCHQLEVYRDDKALGGAGAAGSPKKLNELLASLHIPLSHSLEALQASEREEQKKTAEALKRWLPQMPASIRHVWDVNAQFRMGMNPYGKALSDLNDALKAEIPDRRERIRRLLVLYGSGEGPWSGFGAYELISDDLLQDYATEDIVAVAQAPDANDALLEGAARYLCGWNFSRHHPQDFKLIPTQLKARLLEHTLHSGDLEDDERRKCAMQVFGGR
ncbi:hypothetical protein [Dyella choica]|uniref:Cytochrome c domain-containing protein n=1 Tax=Dyella choica TaxID=1927959 RepID=A0A3S0SA51_9GAMM|nr:hypothetical protein [Dyella choica]RUL75945.1 hypothetical protein EKH80_09475 [Dyella choica]